MKILKLYFALLLFVTFSCRQSNAPVQETTDTISKIETGADQLGKQPPAILYGDLLVEAQMQHIFPDGKTFVDCSPKRAVSDILKDYEAKKGEESFDLKEFVLENFNLPHQYASGFKSDSTKSVSEHINSLWPVLTRNADKDAEGTLIPLPNSYIVPGGRFGEIYYWDSYFTMLGLQAAGEVEMIENMVDNFSYLIDKIGFIPNGNRTYFLGRSQPPFYSLMVGVLAEEKGEEIYSKYLPQLEKEYAFWMAGSDNLTIQKPAHRRVVRMVDGSVLNRYWDDLPGPREESYREDVETANKTDRPKEEVYRHLRAGAESGWDYSSRWLKDARNLETIHTTDIMPVDLNSLLFNLERMIAKGYLVAGNQEKADIFKAKGDQRAETINRYNWFGPSGYYMDFDYTIGEPTYVPSIAGMFPLYFRIASKEQAAACAKVIEEDFLRAGGVVSTVHSTGQQWDAPNGWAPLQWITIKGLRNYGYNDLANKISERWIGLNERVYEETGKMVEKYNVMDASLEGGGGEYPVQDGFGWTNGVLLKLLSEIPN